MAIKIWHQSLTDLTVLPGYKTMLEEHAKAVCSPDTVVNVHGLQAGTYPNGLQPIEMGRYNWAHQLVFVQVVENCRRAEKEGYDAVAISCFVDPGLEDARSLVDIPIVSSCETALLISAAIGRAPSLITLEESMARTLRRLVRSYGYENRVKTIAWMDPPVTERELDRAFSGSPDFVSRFQSQATRLIEGGADVIIPAEGVLNTVLVRNNVTHVQGTPVLDSYGSLVAFAEMLAQLFRRTSLAVGRSGAYARPSQDLVTHLHKLTGEILLRSASK